LGTQPRREGCSRRRSPPDIRRPPPTHPGFSLASNDRLATPARSRPLWRL
jgi:hypothetical protein